MSQIGRTCEHLYYPPDADPDTVEGTRDCVELATHIGCTPYSGSATCAAHKCRCAQAIDSEGKTRTDRRRDAASAEVSVLNLAIKWAGNQAEDRTLATAVFEMLEARKRYSDTFGASNPFTPSKYEPEPEE